MALKHNVQDADEHFIIDPDSRKIIKQSSGKSYLMQYDHNSEVFTFEVPLEIENHDMSKCDVVEIHYENTSTGTSASARKMARGIIAILKDDINVNEDNITFGWTVSDAATSYAGTLKFQLKFICYDKDDENIKGYKWHTDVNDDMTIKAGLPQTEEDLPPKVTATLKSLEVVETETGVDIILDGVHHHIFNGDAMQAVMDGAEYKRNKTKTITANSTDNEYPSAKAVYQLLNSSIVSALNTDVEV